jgi:hypothetical protein
MHQRSTSLSVAFAIALVMAASVSGAVRTSGPERFHGGLVASGASGERRLIGGAIAMSGVLNGVGRIVERPNRRGDSDRVSRDDLVFNGGALHIKSTNGHMSVAVNRRTCTVTFKIQQTTSVEGGTGRFKGAGGHFAATVVGSAVAGRKPDGSCDQQHPALVEIDTITGSGTLTF